MEQLVSIIIPIYGVEKYIERCAVSLFEQTYTKIEYIFVNDCTPDKSIEKLNEVLKKYPARKASVNVVNNITNCGLAAVRNIGVKHCHGQFLMHVDSDDWLDVDVVEECVKKQKDTNADIVAFDRILYLPNKIQKKSATEASSKEEFLIQMLKREREISIWGMLIRTSLYKENHIRCAEGINMSEDYQTSPRLAYYAKQIAILHGVAYNYECRNQKSISAMFTEKNVKQELVTLNVLDVFFADKPEMFKSAFLIGKAKQFCYFRQNSAFYGLKNIYDEINCKLNSISHKTRQALPLPYRIGLSIHNISLLKIYVGILKYFKNKLL